MVPLSTTLKYITECQSIIMHGTCCSTKIEFRQYCQNVHAKQPPVDVKTPKNGILQSIMLRFNLYRKKYRLMLTGYLLYTNTVDNLNYEVFFKDFNMPDTLFSWFLITELHVWMLMARFMAEGDRGKVVRNNIVEAMWRDVTVRIDKLGFIAGKVKRRQIMDLSYQFNAAILGYDEGILSDDKVLAGSLWRRYFVSQCNNPEHIEKLLIYVRKQMSILDEIPTEELFAKTQIDWIDLRNVS
nr:PREDICTED: ubiquinol-cytochrome-c reductase complex assembly factor 1 isoform X2 [Megachile rotundata]